MPSRNLGSNWGRAWRYTQVDKAQSKAMYEEGNEGRPEYAALQGAVPKIIMDSGCVTAGFLSYRIIDYLIHSSSSRHMLCVWEKLRCLFESLYWYFISLVFTDAVVISRFTNHYPGMFQNKDYLKFLKAIRECIFCISSPGG